jgi:hypothetical protein
MSYKRKDTFARVRSWNVHLRPDGKRTHAKKERGAAKKIIASAVREAKDLM